MLYFDSDYFTYINDELCCEQVRLKNIIEKTGTPVYVYSKRFFTDRYREFYDAFKSIKHTIFFAAKSNLNLNVIKVFSDLGSGVDVNSRGELYRALEAGTSPDKILLTGVGKTEEEIRYGIEKKVLFIKAESPQEIQLINEIAADMNETAPIAIRVNPDVDPRTHPYISTGLAESKFGVSSKEALQLFEKSARLSNIRVVGLDMHIGSQITSIDPFAEAVEKLAEMFLKIRSRGIEIEHFDIGGGIGVRYYDEETFTPAQFAERLIPIFQSLDAEIIFEPGRYLTANGGILASKVLYTKKNLNKNFVVVDAAMNDILRPSIYKAYHHIQPVDKKNRSDITADIVGPICESGDFLAKDRNITECESGDYLAVMSAGAYGMVMASNYNARLKPPEVIVDGDKFYITRRRETYEQLLTNESIVDGLHG
jgi:diaminopimelate decarboxylase